MGSEGVEDIGRHISFASPSNFNVSSSQDLVAVSGQRRPAKPSGASCIMQSTTTCCTDCVMRPQAHVTDSWTPQSFNVSVPQRRRFSFTHWLRLRSAPGGSTGLDLTRDLTRLPPKEHLRWQ